MEIAHGSGVAVVGRRNKGAGIFKPDDYIQADALVTAEKNLFLFLLTGDCLPVIFYDPRKEVVALAHLSRFNAPTVFLEKIVKTISGLGGNAEDTLVGIGPAIHKESYRFFKEEVEAKLPNWRELGVLIEETPDGKLAVDPIGYVVEKLVSLGVRGENIEESEIDTAKDLNFTSHYSAGNTGEPEWRMATVAGMKAR